MLAAAAAARRLKANSLTRDLEITDELRMDLRGRAADVSEDRPSVFSSLCSRT